MSVKTWRFTPHDTWFFRESRPHGVVGGAELGSLFPPPARTLAGATRFLMGEAVGIDWRRFKSGTDGAGPNGGPLREVIGFSDDMGRLCMRGPWLARRRQAASGNAPEETVERLYPAPAFLFRETSTPRDEGTKPDSRPVRRLELGEFVSCDLGRVRLPQFPNDQRGKTLEQTWLTAAGLRDVLAGDPPQSDDVIALPDILANEPRLGIARCNAKRTNLDGLLYQTRHVRLNPGWCVEVDINVDDERLQRPQSNVRLGGEGRMATVEVANAGGALPEAPTASLEATPETTWLALCLLTHADLSTRDETSQTRPSWVPPGLTRNDHAEHTTWKGTLTFQRANGTDGSLPLTLHSAFLGKPGREGGWDLARGTPRPVRSLVPAGSVWLCTLDPGSDVQEAIEALHGAFIGNDTEIGRGQIAVGLWPERS